MLRNTKLDRGKTTAGPLLACRIALGRVGLQDDIGAAVAAILSDDMARADRKTLDISGGQFFCSLRCMGSFLTQSVEAHDGTPQALRLSRPMCGAMGCSGQGGHVLRV
jgi:hypothetical protein